MLDRLPFYGQVGVFAALALGIVLAAYALYPNLGEKRGRIEDYKTEYADKEAEIRTARAAQQGLPELERQIAQKKEQLEDLEQILPSDRETGDLLRYIKSLADQSNLDLKSFAPGGLRPAEFYKEFPIEMQMTGRYHDLGLFLDRVSKYSRIINVDNLRIGSVREAGRTIQSSLTATTFVYSSAGREE